MIHLKPCTTLYLDESGFTGANLLNEDQPVFTCASSILADDATHDLIASTIGLPTGNVLELSHSSLVKTPLGRERVIRLITRLVEDHSKEVAYYAIHKRFALLAKLIDNWIEPFLFRNGYNLYENGGAIAYLNMVWACLPAFDGESRFQQLLIEFEKFSRNKTPNNFERFFNFVLYLFQSSHSEDGQGILALIYQAKSLGATHIKNLGALAGDIAFPAVFSTIAHWDEILNRNFNIVHDDSKNLKSMHWLLDAVMDIAAVERKTVAFDARMSYALPFRAEEVRFGDSREHMQLQLCDVLAGASAAVGRFAIDKNYRPEYAAELMAVGIENLCLGMIWPNPDDIRRHGLAASHLSDPLKEVARLLEIARPREDRIDS